MRQHAVLITVLFALAVTLLSVSLVFWEFYKLNKQQYIDHIFTKYSTITQIYRQHEQRKNPQIMLEANLAIYKLRIEKDADKQNNILNTGKILKQEGFKRVEQELMLHSKHFFYKRDSS